MKLVLAAIFIIILFLSSSSFAGADISNENDDDFAYVPINDCIIEAKITNVDAGQFSSLIPDGEGGMRSANIIFTELTVDIKTHKDIVKNGCKQPMLIPPYKYGLCEDIDLYAGDFVRAGLDDWQYSAGCLSNVFVLEREK